ncbi:hypothetical protein AUJ65_06445 [Candidatus Micrarchaeota archaeon CG1_02_51_15]|nr:MAG: hypothetical protein AUJ65_06445 [Candidatus Micrarchaeota archaeon CG1_02_51_15]
MRTIKLTRTQYKKDFSRPKKPPYAKPFNCISALIGSVTLERGVKKSRNELENKSEEILSFS